MSGTSIYGFDRQFTQHCGAVSLNAFPINTVTTVYAFTVPVGFGKCRIVKVAWVSPQVNLDSDGTMLVSVLVRDASEAADDTIVNAASVEGNTAHALAEFALAAETSENELTLEEGDSVRVTFTNNSAAIDTNGPIGVTVFYHSIPKETAGDDIKHAGFYQP